MLFSLLVFLFWNAVRIKDYIIIVNNNIIVSRTDKVGKGGSCPCEGESRII